MNDWNIKDLNNFQNKILNEKHLYMGEIIGDYTFGGAGQKCIKLNGTVPEETEFITYEDVMNRETKTAKDVYNFFFQDEEEVDTSIIVEEVDNNFDDNTLEDVLSEKELVDLSEDMVYMAHDVSSKPFRSNEEKIEYVKTNYTYLFYNDNKVFLVRKSDIDNDWEYEYFKRDTTYNQIIGV